MLLGQIVKPEPGGLLVPEDCFNGVDDNGDLAPDCADLACAVLVVCGGPLREVCDNQFDDDADMAVDCADQDCFSSSRCSAPAELWCGDGTDDDFDGAKDCEDADCSFEPACSGLPPAEACANGWDDDLDQLVDCDDPACRDHPACLRPELCASGADEDGDGAIDCADVDCAFEPSCDGESGPDEPEAICGDGLVDVSEECDDANTLDLDGCSAICTIEFEPALGESDDGTIQDVAHLDVVRGAIRPEGDDDVYRIVLPAGSRLTVETSDGAGGCSLDTVLQLFGEQMPEPPPTSTSCATEAEAIGCDDDGAGSGLCSLLTYTTAVEATVHVRVLGYGGRITGEYSIAFTVEAEHAQGEFEPNDEPSTANEIAPGDTLAGMVSPNDDEDWFSVALVAGQRRDRLRPRIAACRIPISDCTSS